jgi:electron transport complex protein RnfE
VVPDYQGFLLAILPPGAFVTLGLLIAGKNYMTLRAAANEQRKKFILLGASPAREA